jgi:hypothetical protein
VDEVVWTGMWEEKSGREGGVLVVYRRKRDLRRQ